MAEIAKKVWRKPELKTLQAGSAEAGPGSTNDGTGGGAIKS